MKGVGYTKDDKNKNPSPYWFVGVATKGTIYLHTHGAIPDEYQPTTMVVQSSYTGNLAYYINTGGAICAHNSSGVGSKTGDGLTISQNLLYHY